jgi:hypothetical protein
MEFDDLRRELAGRLAALSQGDALILGEPVEVSKRRGFRKQQVPPSRFVQFLRDPEHLYGECVGSTVFGGDWETSEADHQRIRALGWLAPGDPDPSGTRPGYPNYWCCLPESQADELATMAIGALDVLGAEPAALEWRTS